MMMNLNRARQGIVPDCQLLDLNPQSDSSHPVALPRLMFSCNSDDDQHYVHTFQQRYAEDYHCTMVKAFETCHVSGLDYVGWLESEANVGAGTTVVVLIGPETSTYANVDWDVAAALSVDEKKASGLVGVMLPEYFDSAPTIRNLRGLPPRLATNVESGYAALYTWSYVMHSFLNVRNMLSDAQRRSECMTANRDNRLPLFKG
ncbi:MAG: TIR domain-containing protein [Pseudomonadales bacterium]